ncbi:MAG TPA: alpha/beta fold hydrolase [Usitatibacter sp.]|nr:alpha/beta fold hydrolase [Usitatibacter sp.]
MNAAAAASRCEDEARAMMAAIQQRDFAAATRDFGAEMKQGLGNAKLAQVMDSLAAKLGPLVRLGEARTSRAGNQDLVIVPSHFERGDLDARVACDDAGRITGFHMLPAAPARESSGYRVPPYADLASTQKVAVTVGPAELPGELVLPKGLAKVPAVVMLHGSGPHDMDETIGPNKPFLDIALGLAAKGVASLRYEKRTRAHPELFAKREDITLAREVDDDAVAAVRMLEQRPEVDRDRIYLVGHSLGGQLAPRIAAKEHLAGAVLLAPPAAPLPETLERQLNSVSHGKGSDATVSALRTQAAHLKALLAGEDAPADLPFGLPASYWRELAARDPIADAKAASCRFLVQQGGRDYQVTLADDYRLWERAFASDPRIELRTYPALNHLFQRGSGPSGPQEYTVAQNVAPEVIDDMAAWIKAPAPSSSAIR